MRVAIALDRLRSRFPTLFSAGPKGRPSSAAMHYAKTPQVTLSKSAYPPLNHLTSLLTINYSESTPISSSC